MLPRSLSFSLLAPAFFMMLVALPFGTANADTDGAGKFIQTIGDKAVATLANKSISADAQSETFRSMLHTSFDLDLLGRFALGQEWKTLNAEQKQEYLRLFEKLVVQIYSDRFSMYSGQSFKVTATKPEDDRDSFVTSQIVSPAGGDPTEVDWRVRNKDGSYKVIDVIVEGVSMSVSQRSEFMASIQRNGGNFDEFLKVLRDRVNATTGAAPANE